MQLDRPQRPTLWDIKGGPPSSPAREPARLGPGRTTGRDWNLLFGIGGMSSFPYQNFTRKASQDVATQSNLASDRYLPFMVQAQRLMEEVGDVLVNADEKDSIEAITADVMVLRQKMERLKSSIKLSGNESPFLLMQVSVINSHITQCFLPGFPFATGNGRPLQQRHDTSSSSQFVDALSDSIAASKRQITDLLVALPPGHEFFLTNLQWVAVHQGLRMAAKLDAAASHPRIANLTERSRRFLDVTNTIRQIMLRLESAMTPELDVMGDGDAMWHFRRWFELVERWHLSHLQSADNLATSPTVTTPMTATTTPDTSSIAVDDMIDPRLWTVGTPIDGPQDPSNGYLGQSGMAGQGDVAFSIIDMINNDGVIKGYDSGSYTGPERYGSAHSSEQHSL